MRVCSCQLSEEQLSVRFFSEKPVSCQLSEEWFPSVLRRFSISGWELSEAGFIGFIGFSG